MDITGQLLEFQTMELYNLLLTLNNSINIR